MYLPDYTALRPRSIIDVHKADSISVIINIKKLVQQRRKILKPEKDIYPISAVKCKDACYYTYCQKCGPIHCIVQLRLRNWCWLWKGTAVLRS
jgi:hypothetical protein